MIKSTVNPSSSSPIVAVCSQPAAVDDAAGTLFAGILCKPIVRSGCSNTRERRKLTALVLPAIADEGRPARGLVPPRLQARSQA